MKGTDWGRIVARLTAVLVLTRAFDYTYQVVEMYVQNQEYELTGYPEYDAVRIIIAAVLLGLSIALWVFADRFAPKSQSENDVVAEPNKLVIAIVAAIGTLLFIRYIDYAFSFGIIRAFSGDGMRQKVFSAHVIYGATLALLSALMVVYARKAARWLTK